MVSFLNRQLEFQDKDVNINKFLVNVTRWQYNKAQIDSGHKGAKRKAAARRKGKVQGN